jgi:hypothetical protein
MKILKRTRFCTLLVASLAAAILGGCSKTGDAPVPGLLETRAIAEEGLIYGLPIVMNYAVMQQFAVNKDSGQFRAPFNVLHSDHRVFTWKDTAIVTPNSDTPYSVAWLDLRAEPMVITVPAVDPQRYYSVQLVDGNTYNYGYIGSRATGSEAGDYLVVGPDWQGEKPDGIKALFRSTTPYSMALFRTQLFTPADMPEVEKVQAGYQARPLSAFLGQPAPAAVAQPDFLPATTDGIKENFFEYLDAALLYVPETADTQAVRARLASIGVGPGKSFSHQDLSLLHQGALLLGMKAGGEQIADFLTDGIKTINGWRVGSIFGDQAFFNGNWLMRAAAAKAGIYGNDAVEAMYPATRSDANDQPLDTSKHNYSITFPADQLPPAKSFWSITLYDGDSQLLVKNPIDRYLINSPMLPDMQKNADGSLTIYIQKDSPGKDKQANWLPAADGPIYLAMRLYWPETTEPSILPAGAGSWQPPGIVQAE